MILAAVILETRSAMVNRRELIMSDQIGEQGCANNGNKP